MNLQELKNRSILLFGKSRAFKTQEFDSQMKHHNIRVLKEYDESVSLIVDGRMMTPLEQNESERLYETKELDFLSIDALERELAKEIDEDYRDVNIDFSEEEQIRIWEKELVLREKELAQRENNSNKNSKKN